jgi:hypothetical protein
MNRMHKGFQLKTLGVLAAALLSGSVFATGPTLDDLPTVIMTDRMNNADVTTDPANPFDYFTDETQNIYRFTDAFVLSDYVNYSLNAANVNYLFTETDASLVQRTGVNRRILVNNDLAFDTSAAPTVAEVNAANIDIVGAGALDFRDLFFTTWSSNDQSGVPTLNPYPGTGNANLAAMDGGDGNVDPGDLNETSIISIFVADETLLNGDTKSFNVITTNDPAFLSDTLSSSGTIFAFEDCWNDFGGWPGFRTDGSIFFNQNTTPPDDDFFRNNQPATITPALTTGLAGAVNPYDGISGSTATVRLQTSIGVPSGPAPYDVLLAPEFAFIQSCDDNANNTAFIAATAGNFYMYRWTVSNSRTQAQVLGEVTNIRFRMGADDDRNVGNALDEFDTGANNIAGNRTIRSYFYAHAAGSLIGAVDVVDVATDDIGTDITLSQLEIFRFSRTDLEALGGTVVFNQGAASFTTADGTTPPGGSAAFDLTNVWVANQLNANAGAVGSVRPIQTTGSGANVLVLDATATNAAANNFGFWDTTNGQFTDFVNEFAVDNGQLAVLDVWMNSPDAATVNNNLPSARIQIQGNRAFNGADQGVANSQGRAASLNFATDNRTPTDALSNPNPSLLALATTSKRYTAAFEPQLVSGETELEGLALIGMTAFDCFPDFNENGLADDFGIDGDQNGTFNIERVVVTVYDLPADTFTLPSGTCTNP